jgi:CRISPR system Cascade subunit CasC
MFKEIFDENKLAFRTKSPVELIAKEIRNLSPDISDEEILKKSATAFILATKKPQKDTSKNQKDTEKKIADLIKKMKDGKSSDALFFISKTEAEKLAKLAVNGEDDAVTYQNAITNDLSVEVLLFGRMVADNAVLNCDACCQVAHSISTHAVQTEYDYFTAVDDCSSEDNAGAGHLGTMEFDSATLYRYATVNFSELAEKLGTDDAADALKGFAEAFICSMPTGKQNSYANRTLPDAVYVTVRTDQPVNLSGAFEKAVYSRDGYAEKSVKVLFDYADKVYSNFCGSPEKSFFVSNFDDIDTASNAEKLSLAELLAKIYECVNYNVNEVV